MHHAAFLTVVAAFTDAVCEQVALQHVPTSHPIVEVNPSPRSVEVDVLSNVGESRRSLKPHARLLLNEPNLSNQVANHVGVPGLITTACLQ